MTQANIELLCDVDVFLGLTYIIPMLEIVHGLSKIVQSWDILICDFVATMKECGEKYSYN
jgi:hypothetical protein